jgi:hypothetical protein
MAPKDDPRKRLDEPRPASRRASEDSMKEVMEQFNAMIHDEF